MGSSVEIRQTTVIYRNEVGLSPVERIGLVLRYSTAMCHTLMGRAIALGILETFPFLTDSSNSLEVALETYNLATVFYKYKGTKWVVQAIIFCKTLEAQRATQCNTKFFSDWVGKYRPILGCMQDSLHLGGIADREQGSFA